MADNLRLDNILAGYVVQLAMDVGGIVFDLGSTRSLFWYHVFYRAHRKIRKPNFILDNYDELVADVYLFHRYSFLS